MSKKKKIIIWSAVTVGLMYATYVVSTNLGAKYATDIIKDIAECEPETYENICRLFRELGGFETKGVRVIAKRFCK